MVNVQIQQADRRNENREGPADRHRHQFHEQHEDGVHEEDVAAHDVADDALVDEAGVRVEQRVHGEQRIGAERHRVGRGAVTQREQDKRREDQAEEELTNIVLARQAAEGLRDDRMHSVFPCCWQHRVCRGIPPGQSVKRPSSFASSRSRPRYCALFIEFRREPCGASFCRSADRHLKRLPI